MSARRSGRAAGLTGYRSDLVVSPNAAGVAARACIAFAIIAGVPSLAQRADAFEEPFKLDDTQLEPVTWSDLSGWAADDHLTAFAAFQTSCRPLRKVQRQPDDQRMFNALWDVCRHAADLRLPNTEAARAFYACALRFCRFFTRSSTTAGSASVEVSPRLPYSSSAILRRIRRMILPERVFGSPGANWIRSGEAIGPISLRTHATSSLRRSSVGFSPAIKVT